LLNRWTGRDVAPVTPPGIANRVRSVADNKRDTIYEVECFWRQSASGEWSARLIDRQTGEEHLARSATELWAVLQAFIYRSTVSLANEPEARDDPLPADSGEAFR
jgi:hypothetical protein